MEKQTKTSQSYSRAILGVVVRGALQNRDKPLIKDRLCVCVLETKRGILMLLFLDN